MEVPDELKEGFKRLKKEGKQRIRSDEYNLLLSHKSPLTDNDFMPHGEHRYIKMQNVPATYLHSLWVRGMKDEDCAVANYIRDALPILRLEYKSGKWS